MSWPELLERVVAGEDLDVTSAEQAMAAMMSDDATPAQIASLLTALRAKGETADEIAGMARTMRALSVKVDAGVPVVDTCGTGGDGSDSVNLSTMSALVVAAAGVPVAKHGNRAASSRCGSADVLEALGVAIDLSPAGVRACIDAAGIGFCFARRFHPAMRAVAPVRAELGIRTIFNVLGPLTNPAGARRQVVGVPSARIGELMAHALALLDAEHAIVVLGHDGLDELSTAGPARIWTVRAGAVTEGLLDPAELGFDPAPTAALAGGLPADNARHVRAVLGGQQGPIRDAVILNAGLALVVADASADLEEGCRRAAEVIDQGAVIETLDRFVAVSRAQAS